MFKGVFARENSASVFRGRLGAVGSSVVLLNQDRMKISRRPEPGLEFLCLVCNVPATWLRYFCVGVSANANFPFN